MQPTPPTALLGAIDRRLTVLASCSFLVHFGALGTLYGDWSDPLVNEDARLATLVEELRSLPDPPLEQVEERAKPGPGFHSPDAVEPSRGTGHQGPAPGPNGGKSLARSGANGRFGERPSARLAAELAALDGRLAPSLNGPGHATDSVLQRAELPLRMLEEIGRPASAGEIAGAGDLTLGGTPGVALRPGSLLAALPGERMAWSDQSSSGVSPDVKKPGGHAIPGPPPTTFICLYPPPPVRVSNLEMRACYRRGLNEDPGMRGSLRVLVTVGANGEVVSVKNAAMLGNLSSSVIACVIARIRSAHFDPPEGGGAVLTIPISFMPL